MAGKRKDRDPQPHRFEFAALSELERSGARVWGRRGGPRPGPSGGDRRKTVQLYRNWSEHKPEHTSPPWSMRSLVACGCLGAHCVCGCLADRGSTMTISNVGNQFAHRLDAPAADFDDELYPSAVVIGIFTQLRERLMAHTWPHFGEGRFPPATFETIYYRLVMLPFGGGSWWNGHWMGLASWKPGEYRRLMRREA